MIVRACAVLALAVLAAGCGSSSKPPTAAAWANDLCTSVDTWQSSVKSTVRSITAANVSKNTLRSASHDIQSATNDLTDSVKKLGKPPTQSGAQAQQTVDQLSTQIHDDVQKMNDAVDSAQDIQGVLSAVSVVSNTLLTMGDQAQAAYKSLQNLDARGELQQAFSQSSACKQLQSNLSH